MTQASNKKQIIKIFRKLQNFVDALGILGLTLFIVLKLPKEVLSADPATGGDTGSHFWPLWALAYHGIPEGTLRPWNPGNLLGEPHLLHYFPFPFILMWLFSKVMPLGMAFNIGTILPSIVVPFSSYFCLRGLGLKFPVPLLGAVFSMFFLFNESYSMAGGNLLSTLAGQFAHVYALIFFLFGLGFLGYEIRNKRVPLFSTVFFALVFISHGYLFIGLPFLVLGAILFLPLGSLLTRSTYALFALSFAGLLVLWFLLPLVTHAPWTTAFSAHWDLKQTLRDSKALIMLPLPVIFILCTLCFFIFKRTRRQKKWIFSHLGFWISTVVVYLVFYFLAKPLGLVNIRAIPQLFLFFALLTAVLTGYVMRRTLRLPTSLFLMIPILFLSLYWVEINTKKLPSWLKWNYSGWKVKPLYKKLEELSTHLSGTFSAPRVIFEHHDRYNATGTIRVFEMLPYFTGRATLESQYLQANQISPMVFYLQAEVSMKPSCPFWELTCPKPDIHKALPRLRLMGVEDFILTTPEMIAQARKSPDLIEGKTVPPWTLFHMKEKVSLVEVFHSTPKALPEDSPILASPLKPRVKEFKKTFYDWFKTYDGTQPFLTVGAKKEWLDNSYLWQSNESCSPSVSVHFNFMKLQTPCPGRPHLLKFTYHPTWKADSGDPIFMVSPGLMGTIPSKNVVEYRFGQSPLWTLSTFVSLMALLLFPVGLYYYKTLFIKGYLNEHR